MSLEASGPTATPPGIQPVPEVQRRYAGVVGFWLSLAAPVAFLSITLFRPGWGSPVSALGGLTIMVTPPIALLLSIVGLIRGGHRVAAICGTVISGVFVALLGVLIGLSLLRLCQ